MSTFTLIAFTEGEDGWYDRCGDYRDGSPSELDISYFDNAKECGFMWAYTERQYETTKLLIDGIDPNDNGDENRMNAWNEARKFRDEQSDILRAEHDRKEKEKKELQMRLQAENEAQKRAENERKEREQLANLLKKYGG